MKEVSLIEKTLAGETEAFGQLVLQYQKPIYRLIYRIIGNSADASDIAQEAFIKAYQKLDSLKDRCKFHGWLMKIATNECYSWIRKRQDNLFSLEQEAIETQTWHFPPAPDELIVKEELYKRVMSVLAELPEKDQKVIELFYLEEKSYQEIQQQLGISKSVLGWRLSNARAKLRQKLQVALHGIAFWRHFQWRQITDLANVKILSISAAKFFFLSIVLHLAIIVTVPSLYYGKGYNQGREKIHGGGLMSAALLSSESQEPDQLHLYPLEQVSAPAVPIEQEGQNDAKVWATNPNLVTTSIRPIEQPFLKSSNSPPRQQNKTPRLRLLVQDETSLSFDVVAVMESSVNEDVIENIPHNQSVQPILRKIEKNAIGQDFQSQSDFLALMEGDAQEANLSKNDISSVEIELEENPTRILKGHKNAVSQIVFSPDGKLLASASRDSTIRLWDMTTGEASVLAGHQGVVSRIAFSPDGKWLASSGGDGEIFLWNVAAKKIAKFLARRSANDLCFSPDGKLLAVLSGSKILFWDMTTQKKLERLDDAYKHYILLETIQARYGQAIAFSPDGDFLAVGDMMGTVNLWDLEERKLLLTLVGPTTKPVPGIWSVQFSPNGQFLAASHIRRNLNLWDLETGQVKHSFIAFEQRTGEVAFNPDSSLLASGRNPVKLWDVDTGQIIKRFKGSQPIAFSPDGKWFACSFGDNTIALWDLSSVCLENVQPATSQGEKPSQIVFISNSYPEEDNLNNIYLMDADGSNQIILATPPENSTSVGGVSVSPDGKKIAFHATSSAGNIDIWVMDSDGQNPSQLTSGREIDSNPAWSPDGKKIAFECGFPKQMDICVMNTDGTNTVTLVNNRAENLDPAWSPDGKKIAFSSNHKEREKVSNIYVMEIHSGKLLKLTNNSGQKQQSRQPAWSPDGKYIAYVSGKYTAFSSNRSREWWRNRPSALFIADTDGKNRKELMDGAIHPIWSKDGKKIIFAADVDGDDEIYAIDADGNSLTKLTQNNEKDSEPDCFVPIQYE